MVWSGYTKLWSAVVAMASDDGFSCFDLIPHSLIAFYVRFKDNE